MPLSIRVKEVQPLDNMMVSVLFVNGVRKKYDVKLLFDEFEQMFRPLRNHPELFRNVYVDCGGCGIAWNSDIDISECELWENGVEED